MSLTTQELQELARAVQNDTATLEQKHLLLKESKALIGACADAVKIIKLKKDITS